SAILDEPTELEEVISDTSAIVPRWRSRGGATVVAMVAGLAPGICAVTKIVGMSTWGSGEAGSRKNATPPASARPSVSSIVATGLAIKGAETFTVRAARRPA